MKHIYYAIICCLEEKQPYIFTLTHKESNLSHEIKPNHEICIDCFDVLSIRGVGLSESNTQNLKEQAKQVRKKIDGLEIEGFLIPNGDHSECWNIDHKIPISKWEEYKLLVSEDQQASPNYYLNLQPMWAIENFSKGSKFEG